MIKNKIAFYIMKYVFFWCNYLFPKFNHFVVFCGYPDFDDMLKGMIPYLPKNTVILVKDFKKTPSWIPNSYKLIKKNSFRGVLYVFLSKKIYFTHGLFSFFKPLSKNRQLVINLWHGMPIKNIGYLDGKLEVAKSHYLLSTSKIFQSIMSQAFGMPLSDVKITGLPRNDLLLNKCNHVYLNKLQLKYKKIHVWLPTYRQSFIGDIRCDGSSSSIFGIDEFNPKKLNKLLLDRNEFVILKPHPMSRVEYNISEFSNILFIDEDWLYERSLTLYEILSISTSLWTDYSSVAVDYLLLKNPIIFILSDLEAYKNTRGLTLIADDIPGNKVFTEDELFMAIKKLGKEDYNISEFHNEKKYTHLF